MKIGFIGCVHSSQVALETLLKMEGIEVVAVITKERSPFNSDHIDLAPICKRFGIPFHYENSQSKTDSLEFMEGFYPDVIYCFGWSYLLSNDFLLLPPLGIIGFHPAKLPQNRGRHPIIWALALGLSATASTFFKLSEGADTGAILSQTDILISHDDDAASLYNKIIVVMKTQIIDFTGRLTNGEADYIEQDHKLSNSWRKRSRKDGLIDWRMRAEDIFNLIRALAKPYPGAEFEYHDSLIPIWKSSICDEVFPRNVEPGRVLEVSGKNILVKCGGDSAIWLFEIEESITAGEYL